MIFLIILLTNLISFTVGAVWLQTKETEFGIKAKFNCEKCEASG